MTLFSDLTDRERDVAIKRADILDQYQGLRDSGYKVAEACAEVGYSNPTISRWSRALENKGMVGLADKKSKRRSGKSIMTDDQKNFLYRTTLTQHQPKLMTIHREEYLQFCASLSQKPVSYSTFLKEFNNIPESVKIMYRKGSKAFADSNPFHIRDWNLVKPMDVIFSDHVQLNFFVYHAGKKVRPWVTWWMDGHSRKALSWMVTLKPNQDTIRVSLLHAIKAYGTPNQAYLDNGKDYKSKSLQGVNADGKVASKLEIMEDETMIKGIFPILHIEPIFATPYNAKAKPIEPAHNYIHNQARLLKYGYTGANVYDKPEYMQTGVKVKGQKKKLDPGRLLTWEEVPDVVDIMFETYNQHDHSGLNAQFKSKDLTPEAVFEQSFDYELFETWKQMVEEQDLTMLMMRVEGKTYKVHSNGVHFRKNYYYHDLLLINQMEGKRVVLRFDPADKNASGEISKIYLYDAKGTFICGAPLRGKNHPTEATGEDYAMVASSKKIRREVTREHYQRITGIVPQIPLEEMSFSKNDESVN
ncbi:MAG: Mu transposase C-terminal domain-containing protein [Candidatus Marinimicrobia bacterium]|nr:Mu transposase C-terminal domain-containing protein [Candidatus Neomarinimicrobiota bacterium]